MWPEEPPFRTKIVRLLEGDLFAFTVDAHGMFVDMPNLYCVVALRPTGIGLATMCAQMAAVCMLHNWAAADGIDLRARIDSFDLFSKEEIAGLRQELRVNLLTRPRAQARGGRRKPRRPVVGNAQWRSRCAAVRDYVVWHAEHAIQRMSTRDERLAEARERLRDFRKWMTAGIRVRKSTSREGMSELAQAALIHAITPGDPSNPFSPRHQHRNFALWLTYIDGGLRLSEPLVMKTADLRLHGRQPELRVHRRPDDAEDPRKNAPRTKTLSHPVQLTDRLSRALHDYIVQYRPGYPGAKKSPYVFFSQLGRPLAIETVVSMYRKLRKKVPGLPEDFTTHLLRYTWNDRFGAATEELGMNADQEMQVRNLHQGWTPTSKQGESYQRRRNRQRGAVIAAKMQNHATEGAA